MIVEILSIIVFFNDWNCRDLMLFLFTQGTVLQFWTPDSLRGYGCGTPNGALWTMCVTIQFYIVAWFMHKIMHKRELYIWGVAFVALITSSIAGQIIIKKVGSEILVKLYGQTIVRYGWLFFIGCLVGEFKRKIIPILSKYWLVFLIVGAVFYITKIDIYAGYYVIWSILLTFGMIGFSYRYPSLAIGPDFSYGIYLYHMIIINVFISIERIGSWLNAIAAFAITVIFSYVSTMTIGKWSANKKRFGC